MNRNFLLLDDPFWNALTTAQASYSLGNENVKKFPGDILPFAGLSSYDEFHLNQLQSYLTEGEEFYVKANCEITSTWKVLGKVNAVQMVCTEFPTLNVDTKSVVQLAEEDMDELFNLVNKVQPGYIKERSYVLGDYFGIRENGKIVAVGGERLKIDGFTEVSAICTLPEYTGKRYAQKIMKVLCHKIIESGNLPFLHVVESNTRAIQLYEFLQFRKRMDFPIIKIKKPESS